MVKRAFVVVGLILCCLCTANGQVVTSDHIVADTSAGLGNKRSARFFENLHSRRDSSRFIRMLYSSVVANPRAGQDSTEARLVKEIAYFSQFTGKRINTIEIFCNGIFENRPDPRSLSGTANSIHHTTDERTIRRNLLFRDGDVLDPLVMMKNQQLINSLPYIASAVILVEPSNYDPDGVDVLVFIRDNWSISADMSGAPPENYYISLYDNNFLGSGTRLGVRTYVSLKDKLYGGNMFEYSISNLWGSFYKADLLAGVGYDECFYEGSLRKEFVLTTDYTAGASGSYNRYYEQQMLVDTILPIWRTKADAWVGKSWYAAPINSSLYVIGSAGIERYLNRPEVRADSNTYYHDRQVALLSLGVYRESFYRGNMIFGYGVIEDIPYGHKFEVTAGPVRSEFFDGWYGGLSLSAGRQLALGYLRGEIFANSCFVDGHSRLGMMGANANYFSHLFGAGTWRIRLFNNVRYLRGTDRLLGEGERLPFTGGDRPRGLKGDLAYGDNRLIVSNETVFFAPFELYGFRFAFYSFADAGWLGDRTAIFENDLFATLGVGFRVKNERLIFKAIQFRFGFAFGKQGRVTYPLFYLSNESRLELPRYTPQPPQQPVFR
jgi:hypothetical protein